MNFFVLIGALAIILSICASSVSAANALASISTSLTQPSISSGNPTDITQRHFNGQGSLTEGTSERLRQRLATYRQVNSNGGDMARRLTRFNGQYPL